MAAGKEARVYWGVALDGTPLAVKIYLMASAEFKKRHEVHRRGQEVREDSQLVEGHHQALGSEGIQESADCEREGGPGADSVLAATENILIMEYIGEPPRPAPIFAETEVDEDDYNWTVKTIRNLYRKAGLVHADLSEYNIFKTAKGERVLFDMGSAVLTTHPESKQMFTRDVTNIARFFRKRGIDSRDPMELVEEIIS